MLNACEHSIRLYSARKIAQLRAKPTGSVAVAAIAGRDSIAAIIEALGTERDISVIVPTSVGTGTEFGDLETVHEATEFLRDRIAALFPGRPLELLTETRFGSEKLWAALNARFAAEIQRRFGMDSPCLACHLYVHLARVPLALALDSTVMISGERDTHDGRIKLSQTADSIDAETRVLKRAGITLLNPLRTLSGTHIETLTPGWPEGARQLECVHSGNFKLADGTVAYDRADHLRYMEEFFEPAGNVVIDAWLGRDDAVRGEDGVPSCDYQKLIQNIL